MTDTLTDLITRLESAAEGSRELNKLIAEHVHGKPRPPLVWGYVPDYTTSIDAALTLVPEGWWTIHAAGGNPGVPENPMAPKWFWGLGCHALPRYAAHDTSADAATPALALCIAALRARLHDMEK